jgi:hypothetical protein
VPFAEMEKEALSPGQIICGEGFVLVGGSRAVNLAGFDVADPQLLVTVTS